MPTNVVDQIADRFVELLCDATDAQDRVHRDHAETIEAQLDLPLIDVRIGSSLPTDTQTFGRRRWVQQMFVDIYVLELELEVSRRLLELQTQSYVALMFDPYDLGIGDTVLLIEPAESSDIGRDSEGAIPIAYRRTTYLVTFEHDLADPTRIT